MLRIGIIGSDNSHAVTFSKLVNFPDTNTGEYLYPDMRITRIFGIDEKITKDSAEAGKIENIDSKPEDMIGMVDAAMVVFRHGDLHMKYALPFIEAGVPTWVDKPFAIAREDAAAMIEAAKARKTLLTGGSTMKYSWDILSANACAKGDSRIGKLKTAVINFPASLDSEYAGIHFYGHHLCEMTLATFGYSPKSIIAHENNGCVAAIVNYVDYQVTMNFIDVSNEYYVLLHGERGTIIREIDANSAFKPGFDKFACMLRSKTMPEPFENLYAPVEMLNDIIESYTYGREVQFKPYKT